MRSQASPLPSLGLVSSAVKWGEWGCSPFAGRKAMVESNALEMTERHLGSPNHRSNAGEATKEHGSGIGNQVRPGKAPGGGA